MNKSAAAGVRKKPKLFELDVVRALAIIAVVLIHATSGATVLEDSSSQAFFFLLNRAMTFAVPVFILISGIVLFYSYEGKWSARTAVSFYRKRAVSLLIPYLLWAAFYYIYNQYVGTHQFVMDWRVFGRMLRWAEWSYHSYFMLIIFQMYILFPLFMTLAAKTSWFRKWLIPTGIAIQGGFYVYRHWFGGAMSHTDRIAPTYMAYFLIGGAIGLYYAPVKAWVEKHALAVYALLVLSGAVYVGLFALNQYRHVRIENTWYELAWFVYVIAAALGFMQLGRFVQARMRYVSVWLTSIGACSFGIYLIHPALLTAFSVKVKAPTAILPYDVYTLGSFAAVFAGSWLLIYLYGQGVKRVKGLLKGNGERGDRASRETGLSQ